MLKEKITKIKNQAAIISEIEDIEFKLVNIFNINWDIKNNSKDYPGVPSDVVAQPTLISNPKTLDIQDILNYISWLGSAPSFKDKDKDKEFIIFTLREALIDISLELIRRRIHQLDK